MDASVYKILVRQMEQAKATVEAIEVVLHGEARADAAAGGRRELPDTVRYDQETEHYVKAISRAHVAILSSAFTPDELRAVSDDIERRKAGAQT